MAFLLSIREARDWASYYYFRSQTKFIELVTYYLNLVLDRSEDYGFNSLAISRYRRRSIPHTSRPNCNNPPVLTRQAPVHTRNPRPSKKRTRKHRKRGIRSHGFHPSNVLAVYKRTRSVSPGYSSSSSSDYFTLTQSSPGYFGDSYFADRPVADPRTPSFEPPPASHPPPSLLPSSPVPTSPPSDKDKGKGKAKASTSPHSLSPQSHQLHVDFDALEAHRSANLGISFRSPERRVPYHRPAEPRYVYDATQDRQPGLALATAAPPTVPSPTAPSPPTPARDEMQIDDQFVIVGRGRNVFGAMGAFIDRLSGTANDVTASHNNEVYEQSSRPGPSSHVPVESSSSTSQLGPYGQSSRPGSSSHVLAESSSSSSQVGPYGQSSRPGPSTHVPADTSSSSSQVGPLHRKRERLATLSPTPASSRRSQKTTARMSTGGKPPRRPVPSFEEATRSLGAMQEALQWSSSPQYKRPRTETDELQEVANELEVVADMPEEVVPTSEESEKELTVADDDGPEVFWDSAHPNIYSYRQVSYRITHEDGHSVIDLISTDEEGDDKKIDKKKRR